MKALTDAIWGKCTSATDLYADIGGRLFKGRAPQGAELPYVVFFVVSSVPEKTYTDDLENALVQFSLFSKTESIVEVEGMFSHLKALYDECDLSVTGYSAIWMRRQNATLMSEEHVTPDGTVNVWHYAVDYEIFMSTN